MKSMFLIILHVLLSRCALHAQGEIGFEQYIYLHAKPEPAFQPIFHIETRQHFYTEIRYNYEEGRTVSLYGGRKFRGGDHTKWNVVPMLGISAGRFGGLSLAFNAELEHGPLYIGSQTQYSHSVQDNADHFFFSWSEAGFSIGEHFYSGLAMQATLQKGWNEFVPGFTAGLQFPRIQVPVYLFHPFQQGRYYILGFIYTLDLRPRRGAM